MSLKSVFEVCFSSRESIFSLISSPRFFQSGLGIMGGHCGNSREPLIDSHSPTDMITELPEPGAIGFDWVAAGRGGVPWLISWPRKKLIKQ